MINKLKRFFNGKKKALIEEINPYIITNIGKHLILGHTDPGPFGDYNGLQEIKLNLPNQDGGFVPKDLIHRLIDFAKEYPNLYNSFCHKKSHVFKTNVIYGDPLGPNYYKVMKELPKLKNYLQNEYTSAEAINVFKDAINQRNER